ncbi:SGNH/GDSL hydrolase family protein [Taibaiella lutea]|uniref:SGNH/GDSL hydrolase family protein n=1 Tax=Taibaiella lutea TaxID=2608001 RepID=A0A5M6CNT0_9BACT|nr:GDSL-type esterase/lipase family protein [Taibaiella lutea]KAA5536871.1 SGNH/GDSL hydrolase family protein [Taibaiella lutea]
MKLTYLALGDSYTIGEQVAAEENFPHQTTAILKNKYNIEIVEPKIIAVTGWTTDELNAAIKEEKIQEHFDIVTLLIGVNNQYRGRDTENYETEFRDLLNQAIAFANGRMSHVFVLSIPDWGVTPFAEGKDRVVIAKQIDAYNKVNKEVTLSLSCNYVEITESTRINGLDESYLTPDKLHYAAKEYKIWSEKLAKSIAEKID